MRGREIGREGEARGREGTAHLEAAALELAVRGGRVLQVGHLERFNPALVAVQPLVTRPLNTDSAANGCADTS